MNTHDMREDMGRLIATVDRLVIDVKDINTCIHSLKGEIARYKGILAGIAMVVGLLPVAIPWLRSILLSVVP